MSCWLLLFYLRFNLNLNHLVFQACVEIVTKAALKEMMLPGILSVAMPVCVGLIFRVIGTYKGAHEKMLGAEAIGSYMMFATVSGILMALFLDNVGGAWVSLHVCLYDLDVMFFECRTMPKSMSSLGTMGGKAVKLTKLL